MGPGQAQRSRAPAARSQDWAQRMIESRDERTRDTLMEKIVHGFAPEALPRSPTKGH